jgi:hypothetical protein
MTERTTVLQSTQIGVEATPGTAVAATKQLQATSFEPAIHTEVTAFRPAGVKFSTLASLNKEWAGAGLSGQMSFSDLVYLLSGVLCQATPVQQGGAAAYKWTFAPQHALGDTVKTFSVEYGDYAQAERFAYGIVNDLTLAFTRDACEISGEMLGRAVATGITKSGNEIQTLAITGSPTGGSFTITYSGQTTGAIAYNAAAAAVQAAMEALSNIGAGNVACAGGPLPGTAVAIEFRGALRQTDVPAITTTNSFTGGTGPSTTITETVKGVALTQIAAVPVMPTMVDIYMDTAYGSLGGTKLTRVFSAEVSIPNRLGPVWALNSAVSGFAAHVENAIEATLNLTLEADATGMGLVAVMRTGATRFARIEATGAIIEGAYPYKATIDLAVKVQDVEPFEDADGVYAYGLSFAVVQDVAWGKAMQVEVTNTLAAL